MKILVLNVGSTSLKYKLFQFPLEQVLASGRIEGIGGALSEFRYETPGRDERRGTASFTSYPEGIQHLLDDLLSDECGCLDSLGELAAVGFKIVLAKNVVGCEFLDAEILAAMEALSPMAPTHNPPSLLAIRSFRELLPETPLIGLFESAFHRTIPEYAWRYPLPWEWAEKYGIRRYGFHGASHQWAAERACAFTGNADLRLVSCHLGDSSSVNATRGATSLDNSFGLSPQSGLVQSGRPGDIDPIVPIWMIEELGMTTGEARHVLSAQSGLAGLSGISGDMKEILNAAHGACLSSETSDCPTPEEATRANLAADVFVYQVRKWIGSAAVILGGLDCLVFTGGIGERSPDLRGRICRDLDFLGVELDPGANAFSKPDADISKHSSRARILILETNEELVVARACARKLKGEPDTASQSSPPPKPGSPKAISPITR